MHRDVSAEERSTVNQAPGIRNRKLSLQTKLAFSSGAFQEALVLGSSPLWALPSCCSTD
jgi:hypothetical protein